MSKTVCIDDDLFDFETDKTTQSKVQLVFKSGAIQDFYIAATPFQFVGMWNTFGKKLKLLANSSQIVFIDKKEVAYYSVASVDDTK